jgi:hypothetical protein
VTKRIELTESTYERSQNEHAAAEANLRQFLDAVASLQNTLGRANTDIKVLPASCWVVVVSRVAKT